MGGGGVVGGREGLCVDGYCDGKCNLKGLRQNGVMFAF